MRRDKLVDGAWYSVKRPKLDTIPAEYRKEGNQFRSTRGMIRVYGAEQDGYEWARINPNDFF